MPWAFSRAQGLYWAQHDHAVATYPASFNSLVLFIVTLVLNVIALYVVRKYREQYE